MSLRPVMRATGAFVAALALAGTLAAAPAEAARFTDSAGRRIAAPDRVSRVFAAGPPAAVFLYTLAPEKMAGWVRRPDADAMAFIAAPYRSLPQTGRLTTEHASATSDTVTAFCPDIVVDVGKVGRNYVWTADLVQRTARVPYALVEDALATTPETYRTLGTLLGAGERAEMLAGRAEQILADARERAARRPAAGPVRVLAVAGPEAAPAALDQELVQLLGIADQAEAGAVGDPEILLAMDAAALAAIRGDARWRQRIAAGAVRLAPAPRVPFGWLGHPPGPNRLLGLRWLADLIAGDPPGPAQAEFVRGFYRDFYGVTLTDAQIAALIGS